MLVSHIHNTSTSNQLVFMFPTPYSIRVLEGWHSGKDSNLESRFWRPMVQPLTDRCILLAGYILARRVGFEPTDGFPPPVFKTGAIDHSATSAYYWWARQVSSLLPPKGTGLQPAAFADSLLTNITILFNLDKKYSETCRTITFIHMGDICSLSVTYGYHLLGGQKQLVKTTYAT